MIKIDLNFKSQGAGNIERSSQETYNFQILENETLIIANYKFAVLDLKLKLKDDNILYQF